MPRKLKSQTTFLDLKKLTRIRNIKKQHSADVYYKIYKLYTKEAKKEVDFVINVLGLLPKDKVFDLGCGFGRHSIELAKRSFNVTGIDISRSLLKIAKKEARRAKVKPNFINKDIRKLKIRNEFVGAIMMLNVFGIMSTEQEDEIILENIYKSLRKRGKIFIDLRNPEKLKKNNLFKPKKIDSLKVRTKSTYYPVQKQVLVERYFYEKGKRKSYNVIARIYTCSELKILFEKHGFKIINFYGDFNGNKYNKDTSPRLILVGEKL